MGILTESLSRRVSRRRGSWRGWARVLDNELLFAVIRTTKHRCCCCCYCYWLEPAQRSGCREQQQRRRGRRRRRRKQNSFERVGAASLCHCQRKILFSLAKTQWVWLSCLSVCRSVGRSVGWPAARFVSLLLDASGPSSVNVSNWRISDEAWVGFGERISSNIGRILEGK